MEPTFESHANDQANYSHVSAKFLSELILGGSWKKEAPGELQVKLACPIINMLIDILRKNCNIVLNK